MFSFIQYIRTLHEQNKLVKAHGFQFSTCTGIPGIEGVISQYKKTANFVCATDTCEGRTVQMGGGWNI